MFGPFCTKRLDRFLDNVSDHFVPIGSNEPTHLPTQEVGVSKSVTQSPGKQIVIVLLVSF